jgi:DNA adenine methylase
LVPGFVSPFLKWPGGKRWLVPFLRELLANERYDRYVEPFLGGGAVFFGLRPERAILSDVNSEIINVYRQVRRRPVWLREQIRALPVDQATYLRLRGSAPGTPAEAAVRFLYLNRTAFSGMYRLNRWGQFNVPFGGGQRTPEAFWRDSLLTLAAEALRGVSLRRADFQRVLAEAGAGDLVFCDPTYTVAHNYNGFVRYNERNFSWKDQQRLARACSRAAARGALVLVTNAAHDEIRKLYPGAEVYEVERWSTLCPDPSMRQQAQKLLFMLRP